MPVTVALSRVTVGAARACTGLAIARPKTAKKTKNGTPVCNMIGSGYLRRAASEVTMFERPVQCQGFKHERDQTQFIRSNRMSCILGHING